MPSNSSVIGMYDVDASVGKHVFRTPCAANEALVTRHKAMAVSDHG